MCETEIVISYEKYDILLKHGTRELPAVLLKKLMRSDHVPI